MVDVHCHIIPAFDDGPRNLEETLAIAEAQQGGGTTTIIATPHVQNDPDIERADRIVERVAQVNKDFAANGITIKVVPGGELHPCMSIIRGLQKGRPITLAGTGKYVLIDLPHSVLPLDFDNVIFELLARAITPILAHPERCPPFRANLDLVDEYRDKGVVFQLNSGSFVGRHGEDAQRVARVLFERRAAHFLASDAHRKGRHTLGSVAQLLATPEHADYVSILTKRSGEAVLAGAPLPALPPPLEPEPSSAGLFSWIASKLRLA